MQPTDYIAPAVIGSGIVYSIWLMYRSFMRGIMKSRRRIEQGRNKKTWL